MKAQVLGWSTDSILCPPKWPGKASPAPSLVKDDQGPGFHRRFYRITFFSQIVYVSCFSGMSEKENL